MICSAKNIVKLLIIIAFSLTYNLAMANTGKVFNIEGTVLLDGEQMEFGDEVKQGDIIKTGSDGKVIVTMADKSVIHIKENTEFKISEYKYSGNAESGSGKSKFALLKGAFRYVSGLIAKNNHDDVGFTAGTATIGIRGSYTSMVFDGSVGLSVDSAIGTAVISFSDGSSFTVSPGNSGSINLQTGTGTTASSALTAALADPTNADVSSLSDDEAIVLAAAIAANAETLGLSDDQVAASIANINTQKPNVATKTNSVSKAVNPNISDALDAANTAAGVTTGETTTTQPAQVSGSPLKLDPETGELTSPD